VNRSEVYAIAAFIGVFLGGIVATITIWKFLSAPHTALKTKVELIEKEISEIKHRITNLETTSSAAIGVREQILKDFGQLRQEHGSLKEWKSGIEQAKIAAEKARDRMEDDIEELWEKFDHLRESVTTYKI
jgi:chromosome segregation ATPase